MRPFFRAIVLGGIVVSVPAAAQQVDNPVSSALRSMLERGQRNLVGAAEEMPADKYGFKPTEGQMSFGQLVLHVAGSNDFMCATISGTKPPERTKLQPTSGKDALVERMKASFDYCTTALARTTDANLGETVPFFGGRTITRAGAMLDLAADWADHYSAAANYLRLNGLLPPTARRRTEQ
jgi:uncharacterized damage-inducible protein DinB